MLARVSMSGDNNYIVKTICSWRDLINEELAPLRRQFLFFDIDAQEKPPL